MYDYTVRGHDRFSIMPEKYLYSSEGGKFMVRAIVGANWGDEGKGKITDMLAKESDIIIRFQGGSNAGSYDYQ